ncbi:MAG: HD-GYP domain-containing protein [Rhodoferax sp.]
MQNANFAQGQAQANPDFLDALVRASDSYSIVASRDIVDVRGLKLWAKGQPVSAALQQRLLERKLMHPIESCLMAEDGVTQVHLVEQMDAFFHSPHPLAQALRPWAAPVAQQLRQIPLHSVAQLLLTTMHATRPQALAHAVTCMALGGCLAQAQSGPMDVRLALLGGLLHDVGETYIQPRYLDHDGTLDLVGHKHMMVHPRVAQLMLAGTTDYPTTLSRAIGEHHERHNGAGYPSRLGGEQISPLGALLAVVETTAGITRHADAPLARASFALRVVPGEFAHRYASVVFNLARQAQETPPPSTTQPDGASPALALAQINAGLQQAQTQVDGLLGQGLDEACRALVLLAQERLARLRVAWNALGLWGLREDQLNEHDRFEMELARYELQLRLHALQRECLLLAQPLGPSQQDTLNPLWRGLLTAA